MARVAAGCLAELGFEVELAWYEPYSLAPHLSVPLTAIGRRQVGSESLVVENGLAGTAIGSLLPELEVTHYRASHPWRDVISRCELHLAVSGTVLAARAFADTGTPFLAWVASDWWGDRAERVRSFSAPRRILDALLVRPLARRLERRLLGAGRIVALSEATRRAVDRVAGRLVAEAVVPAPVDGEVIRPDAAAVVRGRVGFLGRFEDPRKNLPLFLDALAVARDIEPAIHAVVVGSVPSPLHRTAVTRRGLEGSVTFAGELNREAYLQLVRTLDIACVTSHQEGLSIVALEAMAAGAPIASTRCGGPEEFVRDGVNGFLTGFDAAEIAARLVELTRDRDLRRRLSEAARRAVLENYSPKSVRKKLHAALDGLPSEPSRTGRARSHSA